MSDVGNILASLRDEEWLWHPETTSSITNKWRRWNAPPETSYAFHANPTQVRKGDAWIDITPEEGARLTAAYVKFWDDRKRLALQFEIYTDYYANHNGDINEYRAMNEKLSRLENVQPSKIG